MLGALEVKTVIALAQQHQEKWKPLHTAILDCLLAHRNPQSGKCCPSQEVIASHSNAGMRTVQRAIAELEIWGIISASQLRRTAPNQYEINFAPVAAPQQLTLELERRPATVGGPRPAKNPVGGPPTVADRSSIEAQEEAKGEKRAGKPPAPLNSSTYAQSDFDARDWRVLQREISNMREATLGVRKAELVNPKEFFRIACTRAGISVDRGSKLYRQMAS